MATSDQNLTDDVRAVIRKTAKSGKVDYGTPIILRETERRRVVFVPFFIPRTEGTDLACKLITYKKTAPPSDWFVIDEKSLSLDQDASWKLLGALRDHFKVAKEKDTGEYLLIRVSEGTAQLGQHDPAAIAGALTKVLSQSEIIQHLANTELSEGLANALRGAIRLSEMRRAVAELRQHLEGGVTGEQTYQDWCEKHSWAFGNAYVVRDNVREITPGDNLDILLPSVISGYRDLVELKRPDMSVLHWDDAHRNFYFASDVSKAIGQCHRYLDVLHEVASQGLRDHPEIVAYHPRATIVIGRSNGWGTDKHKALHGLNRRLSGITVMTYDQLLSQGERLVQLLSESDHPEDGDAQNASDDIESFDDVPF